jgi:hypothetical protein
LFDADDPPRSEVRDRDTSECFNCKLGSWIAMGGFGASYTRGTGYHAIGFPIETYFGIPWSRTLLYALRVKPTRYTYLDSHHWKCDVGLHATLGVDVFATGITVERSRHIDPQGRFRPTYFVMVGLEGVISSTWKKYIHPVDPCVNRH